MKTNFNFPSERENWRITPLTESDLQQIEGGWIRVAIGLAIAAGAEIIGDWDNFKRGLAGKPEM